MTSVSATGMTVPDDQRVGHVDDASRGADQRAERLRGDVIRHIADGSDCRTLRQHSHRGHGRLQRDLDRPVAGPGGQFVPGPATAPGVVVHCLLLPHDYPRPRWRSALVDWRCPANEGGSPVPLPLWRDRSPLRQPASREVPPAMSLRACSCLLIPRHTTTRTKRVSAGASINGHHTKIQATRVSSRDGTGVVRRSGAGRCRDTARRPTRAPGRRASAGGCRRPRCAWTSRSTRRGRHCDHRTTRPGRPGAALTGYPENRQRGLCSPQERV